MSTLKTPHAGSKELADSVTHSQVTMSSPSKDNRLSSVPQDGLF
jgi:hypothetical protein